MSKSWDNGFFENLWLKIVRQNSDGQLTDSLGNPIAVIDVVADWAELQAIPKTAANDNIVIHVEGVGVAGSDWRYKHDYGRWFVIGEPVLKMGYTAVAHSATLTDEDVGFEYQLPNDYGGTNTSILQNGDCLIVSSATTKVNTNNAMAIYHRFGTSSGTSGTTLSTHTPGTTSIFVAIENTFQRTSATQIRLTNQTHNSVAGNNQTNTTAYQGNITVSNMDTSSTFYFKHVFKLSTSTGDTNLQVENYNIRLRSGRAG